ncbi:MAG TPA: fibronectin type III domain-containing protein, partial [Planctomycetaceae bacterium]|nr:fibronectin type III domain-containing protein [Planctomycetaceae bacterium]
LNFNGEIGDIPLDMGLSVPQFTTFLGGFLVQDLVDQNDNPLVPATALTAPQNVSAVAISPTTAVVSWDSSFGAQSYRIYLVNGQQNQLLKIVAASTTSTNVSLIPGSTDRLMVEAVNATDIADSQTVTVTMPQPLLPPIVTATPLTSTTAMLSWNAVSGAQGYRIFTMGANNQPVLLGTVDSSTTQITIVGLTPNVPTKFMVEAFHGSVVADSQWVTVQTLGGLQPPLQNPMQTNGLAASRLNSPLH